MSVRGRVLLTLLTAAVATGFAVKAWSLPAETGPGVLPPKLEARYQKLTDELRCPVCQNEPIATSQAQIAGTLRQIVRQRLLAGQSNAQIKQYLISRYGLFAVYKPPLQRSTFLLWFGPFILLLIAIIVVGFAIRQHRRSLLESDAEHQ
ncbi:MAG: cytochrome c-type biogenesis protein [Gammaproteobacteria bacterium]